MEKIITDAEVWIRSADSLSITLFMLILPAGNMYLATAVTLLFLPFWHLNKSAFVNIATTKLMRLVDNEIFLVMLSILVLSWLGMNEQYYSLITGLLFFFLLKFGGYRKLVEAFYRRHPKKLSLNDRVLKMVVLRYAMYEDVDVAEVRKMESDFLKMIRINQKK